MMFMGVTLTKIIIAQLVVIMIATGFWIWIADGVDEYGISVPSDYNDTFITLEETLGELNSTLNSTRYDLEVDGVEDDNNNDFLGFFFNSAYSATKGVKGGVESLYTFTNLAVENTPLAGYGRVIVQVFGALIVVVFVIYLLVHFVIKSERV